MIEMFFDNEIKKVPYESEELFIKDLFCFLDMCINSIYYLMEAEDAKEAQILYMRELRGTVRNAIKCVEGKKKEIGQEKREYVTKELKKACEHIRCRAEATHDINEFRFLKLTGLLGLSRMEEFILLVSMANSYDEKYGVVFSYLQGDDLTYPGIGMILLLYSLFEEAEEEKKADLYQEQGILFRYFLDKKNEGEGGAQNYCISLNRRAVSFLKGYRGIDDNLREYGEFYDTDTLPPEILIRKELCGELEKTIALHLKNRDGRSALINIYGPPGIGKRLFVRTALRKNNKPVIFINLERVLLLGIDEIPVLFAEIAEESLLLSAVPCFVDTREWNMPGEGTQSEASYAEVYPPQLRLLIYLISSELPFSIWISREKGEYLLEHPFHAHFMEMPYLSAGERIFLWKHYLGEGKTKEDVSVSICANRYVLSAGGIKEAVKTADFIRLSQGRSEISMEDIKEAVRQHSPSQLGRFAVKIKAVYTWEDLIIGSEQKHNMQIICDHLKYRSTVGEEWGFNRKNAYGRGICSLFYGEPGTGKTMAAQVMANELGLELYRVDMSQMISKYIGETEKNISAMFKKAKNINALLFFDEADSFFSKRTKITDSNDRNANAEISHLLQKLEDYDGVSILAANYINNIDEAFKRRIKFIIKFTFPTREVRLKLWKSILPDEVPRDEDIDFEFYAENFELSGSSIKEILINASYLAAAKGVGLLNSHIIESVKLNYLKYGKVLSDRDFGYLVY